MGTLFVVSTPIGNLSDLSARAADTLRAADRIVAEDTRRARILLTHLGITTRPASLHRHNEARRSAQLVEWLNQGLNIALISDAGTPLISDPGERAVRGAIDAGHPVVPIPGPSAILAGLVASGLPCATFTFHGFLPRKARLRESVLERIRAAEETSVLFEAPGRLGRLLESLQGILEPGRQVAVCRELTKRHEEVRRGTPEEVAGYYRDAPPKGEVTVIIAGADTETRVAEEHDLLRWAEEALADGDPPGAAARRVARKGGVTRKVGYDAVRKARERMPEGWRGEKQ